MSGAKDLVKERGTFHLRLLSQDECIKSGFEKFPAHREVLEPLLEAANEGWVYGLNPSRKPYQEASEFLKKEKGKYRVLLGGNLIDGYEYFWNATGWERGTVLLLLPRNKIDIKRVFSHCKSVSVMTNFMAGHTPAAIRYARSKVVSSDMIACCFSASNGFEWMDIFAKPEEALRLFLLAYGILGSRYESDGSMI